MTHAPERDAILTSDKLLLSEPKSDDGPLQITHADTMFGSPTERTLAYVRASVSANTRRAYRSDLLHFLRWGGAIPASSGTVAEYLAVHAAALSVATLVHRLVAINRAHTSQGLPSPTSSDLVRMTMRGIRRKHGRPQHQVTAAVKSDILAMVARLDDSLRDKRDRALLLIGFAGAFRRSELRAIDCASIERCNQGIIITIAQSKTDQNGEGRRVGIPYGRGSVCPIKALADWLLVSGIADGPVFRGVTRHGHVANEALSAEAIGLIVKERAAAAGLDPTRYAGHSLRAGLATSAAAAGVPSWKIRQQTGHTSDATLERYIREGELFRDNAAGAVL